MQYPFHRSLMASNENGEKVCSLGKISSGRSSSCSGSCCSGKKVCSLGKISSGRSSSCSGSFCSGGSSSSSCRMG